MKRVSIPLPTLALLTLLGACGGQDADMDMDMDMSQPPAAEAEVAEDDGCYLAGATLQEARERISPHRSLVLDIGTDEARLCYGAPSARGRTIMGALVPYGEPWRIGADEPTTLHLTSPATVGGVSLQPGSYSLYAIPGQSEWQFFINSNWQRWGIPIDAGVRASEIGSFTVVPETLPQPVEQLRYEWHVADGGEPGGELFLEWETTVLRIPIES